MRVRHGASSSAASPPHISPSSNVLLFLAALTFALSVTATATPNMTHKQQASATRGFLSFFFFLNNHSSSGAVYPFIHELDRVLTVFLLPVRNF